MGLADICSDPPDHHNQPIMVLPRGSPMLCSCTYAVLSGLVMLVLALEPTVLAEPRPRARVCMQFEESSGTCRDSIATGHDPLNHVWPRPLLATTSATAAGASSGVKLRNGSFEIVVASGSGGGRMLQEAVARYQVQVFAPVSHGTRANVTAAGAASSSAKTATLRVFVRDQDQDQGVDRKPGRATTSGRNDAPPLIPPLPVPVTEMDESYSLSLGADGGGLLRANTTVGALRGLETFAQLLEYTPAATVELWHLPITILDRPRWNYRGIKIDTSRHFITLPHLRNVVRAMESAKLNVLQWHIIDGQSFPLASARFPELSEHGRYCIDCVYTQDDIRTFVAFARARGVRVIPELDIPGHSGFQYGMPDIVACPQWEGGQGSNRALDPTLDKTYTFLADFLSEQAEVFADRVINVYGDEVRFPCWNQSSSIAQWMKAHGIKEGDFQALTEVFWRRFAAEVAPAVRNRTGAAVMIGEADVFGTDGPPFAFPAWLREADPGYPPLLVEVWGGHTLERSANGTLRKVLQTDGMQAVVGGPYYLDQDLPRSGITPWPAPYWVSVWRTMYSVDPVGDAALSDADKQKVVGLVAEMWGEQINSGVVEQRVFPHALAVAERGWADAKYFANHSQWDAAFYAQVEGRLNHMSCTLNRRGIRSSPSAPGHCSWSRTDTVTDAAHA